MVWHRLTCVTLAAVLAPSLVACGGFRSTKEAAAQRETPEVVEPQAGAEPSGWVTEDDGTARYRDPATGEWLTGWLEDGGTWRYLRDGVPQEGWLELDGSSYYLAADGSVTTGWAEVDGTRCFFDAQGRRVFGWVDDGSGKVYWIKPEDGQPASHEWVEIDGVYQAFDDDGSWVTLGEVVPPDDAAHVAGMSARQRAVVDACDYTAWPGKALCAGWVSSVFANAGEPAVGGDACDMARAWCTSSDLADLRPGMLIAVPSHGRTDNGRIWGHVCIYVGDGLIRDSGTYGVRRSSLGSWLAWFGDLETPKWGWANGIDLSD